MAVQASTEEGYGRHLDVHDCTLPKSIIIQQGAIPAGSPQARGWIFDIRTPPAGCQLAHAPAIGNMGLPRAADSVVVRQALNRECHCHPGFR